LAETQPSCAKYHCNRRLKGKIVGEVSAKRELIEEVGLMMAGKKEEKA
jgi:hypothetical protein